MFIQLIRESQDLLCTHLIQYQDKMLKETIRRAIQEELRSQG